MQQADGQELDFNYLMALIHNAVGPEERQGRRDGEFRGPARGSAAVDELDDVSSCEDGELEQVSAHRNRLSRDVSHYLDQESDASLLDSEEESTSLFGAISPHTSQAAEALLASNINASPYPPFCPPESRARRHVYQNYDSQRMFSDKSLPFHNLEAIMSEFDEADHFFSSDEDDEEEDKKEHVENTAVPLNQDFDENLIVHLSLLGFNPNTVDSVLHQVIVPSNQYTTNDICATKQFLQVIQALVDHPNDGVATIYDKPQEPERLEATSFPWPVFDMAQYEFGNARPGTCFSAVVVVVNLPAVSDDMSEGMHNCLLTQLFSKYFNPIQVVLPQVPSTGLLKGHGFVEFSDREQATTAARALDGLMWSPVHAPLRAMLFREYDGSVEGVKSQPNTDDEEQSLRFHTLDIDSEDEEEQTENQVEHLTQLEQQLVTRNEQLEYLLQCVERDRDSILIENDELRHMMEAYRMREKQQEQALLSLSTLRKRIQTNEQKYREHMRRMRQNEHTMQALRRRHEELTGHPQSLKALGLSELRELEDTLDTALYKVRTIKEQKILEQKQLLDRQMEEQQELKLCVICLTAEKTILCLPCRHVCMCQECSNHNEVVRCPICRLEIQEKMVIYA